MEGKDLCREDKNQGTGSLSGCYDIQENLDLKIINNKNNNNLTTHV